MRSAFAMALPIALSACASQPEMTTQCPDPRPQVCTMEYAPTCALLTSGASKEYASPCNACADDAVVGYLAGPCPE